MTYWRTKSGDSGNWCRVSRASCKAYRAMWSAMGTRRTIRVSWVISSAFSVGVTLTSKSAVVRLTISNSSSSSG